jgi:RHS repeat-associated protein
VQWQRRSPTRLVYSGKERDAESGLDYFGARYYASTMGRWMSPDWADKPEAVPYSSLDNPQSLNLYGYVLNNPLSHADADGHCCEGAWNQFAGAAGGVLNIVPQSINLINSAGNAALSLTSTSYRIPMMDEIQSDAHASAGGMAVGQAAQIFVPVGGEISAGAKGVNLVKGAEEVKATSKVFSAEKQALVDMAKTDKKLGGISKGDMEAYKELNKTLPDPFPADKVRGPESHPSGLPSSQQPHGHVGPVDHIPIKDKTP